MNKNLLFVSPLILATLACDMTIPATPPVQTVTPATQAYEPATTTPEIFISLTQAVPGEFQPTPDATTVTYNPLTVTIPQAVASGASGRDFPRLDSADTAWWERTPGHVQVSLGDYYTLQGKAHQPAIYVYPASAYAEVAPAAFESIHRLQNYLYAPTDLPALAQLPGVPFFSAHILFAAQIQPVSFQNGNGIRYIGEYAQYPAPANSTDLFYTFIGVTGDGEHYIVAVFPLTSPVLAETSDAGAPLPPNGIPYPYLADPAANMDAYYMAVTDLLNVQEPDTFTPHLHQLDTLIQSMLIHS